MIVTPTLRRSGLQNSFMTGMNGIEKELSQWFDAVNNCASGAEFKALEEKDGIWEVLIDVPGVSREQLAINIEGKRVQLQTIEDAPRQYRSAFVLPAEIDVKASVAKLENGVLQLKLARKIADKTATSLEINE